jgi:hypothetical protein
MPQVVKVETRQADLFADLAPDRLVEVRAAQLAALRPDEDEPPIPRLGEPFEVPPDLRRDLGGERDGALSGLRLWRIRPEAALVELSKRLLDAYLAQSTVLSGRVRGCGPSTHRLGLVKIIALFWVVLIVGAALLSVIR